MLSVTAIAVCFVTSGPVSSESRDPFAGAAEVVAWSFDEEDDLDFDARTWQPRDWTRRKGPGFPAYVQTGIDREHGCDSPHSLRFDANGGPAAVYSPPVKIDAAHAYVFEGAVRTEGLQHDAALISISFLNDRRQRVQRLLTRPVTGNHADWVRLRLGPLTPHPDSRFVVLGCHLVPGRKADVRGTAWFDELWLGRLPQFSLAGGFRTHFIERSAPIAFEALVGGLDAERAYRLRLRMLDAGDRVLAEVVSPLDAGQRTIRVAFPPREGGFYRVEAELEAEGRVLVEHGTAFAVIDRVPPQAQGEFGWSMAARTGLPAAEFADIAEQAGINWLKYPLWNSVHESSDEEAATADLLDRLAQRGISTVGLLNDPPAELKRRFAERSTRAGEIFAMSPGTWAPSVDPVMARYSANVQHWQLGDETDFSFLRLPAMPQALRTVKREFDRIGRDTRIGLAWDWQTPLPGPAGMPPGFLSIRSPQSAPPEELLEWLERSSGTAERWIILDPLPATAAPEDRAADLVERMVAARIGGADAIFMSDVFDPDRGLLQSGGAPTLLFLPWRTAALALRGSEYLGSLGLPGGSRNHVFLRDGEAVIVLWSPRPAVEETYLGEAERVAVSDVWGRRTRPRVDARSRRHAIETGPVPVFVHGCSAPVARWRMAARFENGRIRSATGSQPDALLGTNPFNQGVTGTATLNVPPDWEVEPRTWRLQLGAGESFRLPVLVTLPPNATLGTRPVSIDFEIDADRTYRFRVFRTYEVGTGDVLIEVRDRRREDGSLEIEQTIANNTSPPEVLYFDCNLFVPGHKRQKTLVTRLEHGLTSRKYFHVPDADALRGEELWIRAEQVGGRRVLNYRWTVGAEWETGGP